LTHLLPAWLLVWLLGCLLAWLLGCLVAWLVASLVGCSVSDAVCGQCQEELGAALFDWACQADLRQRLTMNDSVGILALCDMLDACFWLLVWLVACLVAWLLGCLVGWSLGCLVAWLVARSQVPSVASVKRSSELLYLAGLVRPI
jgi:hypothetical protein